MAATATAGSGKTLIIQQSAAETATYTISAAAIMESAAGFTIDAVLLDVQTAAGGGTVTITNNGTTILVGASASTAAAGAFILPLTVLTSVLSVAATSNLVVTTNSNTKSRITLVISELSGRSVVVT